MRIRTYGGVRGLSYNSPYSINIKQDLHSKELLTLDIGENKILSYNIKI